MAGGANESPNRRNQDLSDVDFKVKVRGTANSFFKTEKSTVMSSTDGMQPSHMATANNFFRQKSGGGVVKDTSEGDSLPGSAAGSVSDLISNTDHVVTGGTLSILRRRGSKRQNKHQYASNAVRGGGPFIAKEMKGDI